MTLRIISLLLDIFLLNPAVMTSIKCCNARFFTCSTIICFISVLFFPQTSVADPVTLNIRQDPGSPITLNLLNSNGNLAVTFAFKTCRDVDVIRFYRQPDNAQFATVTLRDQYMGFCIERPKRCENSELKIPQNEWTIVRITPYGLSNNQLLFEILKPDGAFKTPLLLENRVISFEYNFDFKPRFQAELSSQFRGCIVPSLGFDISPLFSSKFASFDGNCYMDQPITVKGSSQRAFSGECVINVTCPDGNVCQQCRADEPESCRCIPPYRSSAAIQDGGTIVTQCRLMPTANPCYPANPCRNGGICLTQMNPETNRTSFQCKCSALFRGPLCDEAIDTCRPNPCLNGGVCIADGETQQAMCQCHGTGENFCMFRNTLFTRNAVTSKLRDSHALRRSK